MFGGPDYFFQTVLNAAVFGGKRLDGDHAEDLLRRAELLLGHRVDDSENHDDGD